ncbi:secreted/periplasmic Zn-dependent peptidase, partial [Paenibacillus popilliae ATCC 14706]
MLAKEIEKTEELQEQIMIEIRENNNGKIQDLNLLSQIRQGKRPRGRGSDRRVKQQIQAIREGQKQVNATKNRIAEIAARYDQQM